MGVKSEAKQLRAALAKELFVQAEAELAIEKRAAGVAADRISTLEDQVQHLKAELRENEHARLSLVSRMEILEATEVALEKEKVTDLTRRLNRSVSDLSRAGRTAANSSALAAEAREQAEELGQDIVVLTEKVEKLGTERGELQKNIASLNGRAEKAAQVSAAKISTLQSDLSASRAQVAAILAGVASIRAD